MELERIVLENKQMPLHYQIADYLLHMAKNSEFTATEKLPPEEKLRDIFGVSRATVRHALEHLSRQGVLIKKQGKGNFWTESSQQLKKEKQSGINRQIFQVSEKTSVKVKGKDLEKATDAAAAFLGLDKGAIVYVFRRQRFIAGEPLSYTVNYLPQEIGCKIQKRHLQQMTMLETLENVVGITLGVIEHEVEITRANGVVAGQLGIAPLDPVLTVKTSVFDYLHKPVEIVWTYFVENKYKFKVVLDK